MSKFPQKHHTSHKPDGNTSHFIKKSEHVGAGHNEGPSVRPTFGDNPMDPTSEGLGNPGPAGMPHNSFGE